VLVYHQNQEAVIRSPQGFGHGIQIGYFSYGLGEPQTLFTAGHTLRVVKKCFEQGWFGHHDAPVF
jgi:hypothetical protein